MKSFHGAAFIAAFVFFAQLCIAADVNGPVNEGAFAGKITVACVGDSITHGSGATAGNDYPDQLQRMLGERYVVKNYGVSGATLLKKGDKPYWVQKLYKDSLGSNADVVIIMLGTNDTKPQNWKFQEEFAGDYKALIGEYQNLPTKPRVWVMLPPPVEKNGNYKIVESGVEAEMPVIEEVAKEMGCGVVDVHGAFKEHGDLLPDNVHPNAAGYAVLAGAVYQALKGEAYKGESTVVAGTQGSATQGGHK